MKKIIFLLTIILLLASCKNSGLQGSQDLPKANTGTEALQMNFLEIPQFASINNEYRIVTRIKNIGNEDTNPKMIVGGYSSYTVNNNPEDSFKLTKDDEHDVELSFTTTDIPPTKKEFFTIQACFNYKTKASVPICINPTKDTKVCQTKTVTQVGQGAPIVVTKVEPTINSQVLKLKITVENKGTGRLTELNSCFGDPSIKVDKVEISGTELDCGNQNTLKLKGLENNILECEYNLQDNIQAYTTPLLVELSYGYAQSKSTTVTIEK